MKLSAVSGGRGTADLFLEDNTLPVDCFCFLFDTPVFRPPSFSLLLETFDVVRARSLFPRGLDLDAVSTFVCVEICIRSEE